MIPSLLFSSPWTPLIVGAILCSAILWWWVYQPPKPSVFPILSVLGPLPQHKLLKLRHHPPPWLFYTIFLSLATLLLLSSLSPAKIIPSPPPTQNSKPLLWILDLSPSVFATTTTSSYTQALQEMADTLPAHTNIHILLSHHTAPTLKTTASEVHHHLPALSEQRHRAGFRLASLLPHIKKDWHLYHHIHIFSDDDAHTFQDINPVFLRQNTNISIHLLGSLTQSRTHNLWIQNVLSTPLSTTTTQAPGPDHGPVQDMSDYQLQIHLQRSGPNHDPQASQHPLHSGHIHLHPYPSPQNEDLRYTVPFHISGSQLTIPITLRLPPQPLPELWRLRIVPDHADALAQDNTFFFALRQAKRALLIGSPLGESTLKDPLLATQVSLQSLGYTIHRQDGWPPTASRDDYDLVMIFVLSSQEHIHPETECSTLQPQAPGPDVLQSTDKNVPVFIIPSHAHVPATALCSCAAFLLQNIVSFACPPQLSHPELAQTLTSQGFTALALSSSYSLSPPHQTSSQPVLFHLHSPPSAPTPSSQTTLSASSSSASPSSPAAASSSLILSLIPWNPFSPPSTPPTPSATSAPSTTPSATSQPLTTRIHHASLPLMIKHLLHTFAGSHETPPPALPTQWSYRRAIADITTFLLADTATTSHPSSSSPSTSSSPSAHNRILATQNVPLSESQLTPYPSSASEQRWDSPTSVFNSQHPDLTTPSPLSSLSLSSHSHTTLTDRDPSLYLRALSIALILLLLIEIIAVWTTRSSHSAPSGP